MKTIIATAIAIACTAIASAQETKKNSGEKPAERACCIRNSTPTGFTDDYDAALKTAAERKKPIMAVFSGSDWCYWCKKLEGEVLSAKGFADKAAKDFVLLFIDMPQDQTLLSEKARKENASLCGKYAIRGFPTVLILDEKGERKASTGYRPGGAEGYLKHLQELVK